MLAKEGLFINFPVNPHHEPEVLLYRAVIDQALHDLGSKYPDVQEEADLWFDPVNPDFLEVCDYADIDYRLVLKYIEENHLLISPRTK